MTQQSTSAEASAISEQRQTIDELETPVIEVWEGILALPLIGTVDTRRAQQMTEKLLQRIVDTSSSIVILDITGVPVVVDLAALRDAHRRALEPGLQPLAFDHQRGRAPGIRVSG